MDEAGPSGTVSNRLGKRKEKSMSIRSFFKPRDTNDAARDTGPICPAAKKQRSSDILYPILESDEVQAGVEINKVLTPSIGQTSTVTSEPIDLSEKSDPPRQPIIEFPHTNFNNKMRKFSKSWYSEYTWLEYSIMKDSVYCKPCRFFANHSRSSSECPFSTTGYNNWKKLGDRCKKHSNSEIHKNAEEKLKLFQLTKTTGRVDQQLDPEFQDEHMRTANLEHIRTVLDIVLFLAQQECSLRGDNETSESLNRGNFIELFHFIGNYDKSIVERLEKLPKNARMMSPDIQNELLEASRQELIDTIKKEVISAGKYAIMADEVKDISKKELLGVSLRYLYDNSVKERAIGFIELENLSAVEIAKQLSAMLVPFDLLKHDCVGQSYDGASVMSGVDGGVQAIIRKSGYVNATYYHCASHRLNLVMSSASNVDPIIASFFDIMDMIYTFFTGVKRHSRFMDIQKHMFPNTQPLELVKACETRWSSRSLQLDHFLRRFDCVLNALSSFEDDADSKTRVAANSLLNEANNKKFLMLVVFFNVLFQESNFCTKSLQNKTLDANQSIILINTLKDQMMNFDFAKVISYGNELCGKYQIQDYDLTKSKRQRRLPASFDSSHVMASVGHNTISSDSELVILLKRVISHVSSELNSRFDMDQQGVMRLCAAFGSTECDIEQELIDNVSKQYGFTVPEAEILVFSRFLKKMQLDEPSLFDIYNIVDENVFPGIRLLLKILITIPQTSVTVERLFSSVKRVKTRLRSKMHTQRLSALSLLSFEKDITRKLNRDNIVQRFSKMKDRRLL